MAAQHSGRPRRKGPAFDDALDLPSKPEIEKNIMGGIFCSESPNDTFALVSDVLNVSAFYLEKTRLVFWAMGIVFKAGEAINWITVGNELTRRGQLESIGSITQFTEGMPRLEDISSMCRIVEDCAQRRRLILATDSLQMRIRNESEPLGHIRSEGAQIFSSIFSGDSKINIDQIPNVFSFDSKGIEFAVEGLIARGSVTMLSGESGHGKSTLTAAIADAVTKGATFCGRKCSQLPVLILDRENGIDTIQERFARLGIDNENCKIIVWGGWCESEPADPSAAVVLGWVKKTEPKPLVVIDSVAAFMEGDENSASDVRKFMDKLRQLAHMGAAVITLHNSGKGDTSLEYRGSSDFKGSIDVGINVRNFGEGELGKIRLKAFKTRFAIDREVILNYSGGRFVSDDRPHSASRTVTEQLTALLRKNPGIKTAEFEKLAVGLQLGRDRAREFLDTGVKAGEIRVTLGTNNARFYYLIEPGEDQQ